MRPYPTLGLLYVSAYLRRDGFDVEIFDSTFAERPQLFERLAGGKGVVGIYTNLMTRRPVLDIVVVAKRYGWTVVLGGPESAGYPAEYLACGADVVPAIATVVGAARWLATDHEPTATSATTATAARAVKPRAAGSPSHRRCHQGAWRATATVGRACAASA